MSIARIIEGRDHEIYQCSPQDSVQEAAALLAENRIGALPVVEDEKVVGIFSERDLLYSIAKEGAGALSHQVADVMTGPAITIPSGSDALEALALMTRRRIRHLPVVDDGKMVCFLSIGDLVKFRIEQIETEANQMREYISMA